MDVNIIIEDRGAPHKTQDLVPGTINEGEG